jgi:hypothetical protein
MSRVLIIVIVMAAMAATAASAAAHPAVVPRPTPPPEPSMVFSAGEGGASLEIRVPQVAAAVATSSEPFTPDVYPSQAEAARGLGELWAKRAAENDHEPAKLVVYCCDPAVYARLVEGIRSHLPDARIEKAPAKDCPQGFGDGHPAADETWVLLESHDGGHGRTDLADDEQRPATTGVTLTLRARGATDASAVVNYVDVPWLSNFNAFAQQNPGRRFIVARTDPMRPAMSEAEAAEAARRAAAGQLFGLVRSRVARHGRRSADDGWLYQRVESELASGRLVIEQFPQKFERPSFGGTTWREAVLIDASDPAVDSIASDLSRARAAETQSWLMSVASAGGVLLVTYALYRLANAFTRGYFVWSLRTAAAVVATAAVVVVLMVIG